jgi:hypothetical protein
MVLHILNCQALVPHFNSVDGARYEELDERIKR